MVTRHDQRFQSHGVPVLNREHGGDVVLVGPSGKSATFVARVADREYVADSQDLGLEFSALFVSTDFDLPVSKCVINALAVVPRKGYSIEYDGETFEILPPNDTTAAVEKRKGLFEYRVHTTRVAT